MTIDVASDIAGIVFKIVAAEGASVAEDDEILVLESMKMEIPVAAPKAGRVVAVLVAEGEAVAEGQVIARIEA